MSAIALKTITKTPSILNVPHRHRPAPKHLQDVRCQMMEPWNPEALAPSFWFETIDFPRVFLWSLSSASLFPHASARGTIDSWRWFVTWVLRLRPFGTGTKRQFVQRLCWLARYLAPQKRDYLFCLSSRISIMGELRHEPRLARRARLLHTL